MENNMDNDLEEFHEANKYIFKRQYSRAEEILKIGLTKAINSNSDENASFYYFTLGSVMLSQKKNSDAYKYITQAYELSGNDHYRKLSCASMFASIFAKYDLALKVTNEIINQIPQGDMAIFRAYAIKGICLLKMGRFDDSFEFFIKSIQLDFSQLEVSDSYDITLAAELVMYGATNKEIEDYLEHVYSIANLENDTRMLESISELLSVLRRNKNDEKKERM